LNVVTCIGETAIMPVFYFHSTVVMNFISGGGLFCAYPALTTDHVSIPTAGYYDPGINRSQMDACFEKYTDRGFSFVTAASSNGNGGEHICYRDYCCPRTIRTLYDNGGLFVPFGSTVEEHQIIYDKWHTVLWSVGGPAC
ncbi:hypothetical protein C8J57DRAFT_1038179, partial [Mycena rebaudengoi]